MACSLHGGTPCCSLKQGDGGALCLAYGRWSGPLKLHSYICVCMFGVVSLLPYCCPSLSAKTRDGVKEAFEELVHKVGVAVR